MLSAAHAGQAGVSAAMLLLLLQQQRAHCSTQLQQAIRDVATAQIGGEWGRLSRVLARPSPLVQLTADEEAESERLGLLTLKRLSELGHRASEFRHPAAWVDPAPPMQPPAAGC